MVEYCLKANCDNIQKTDFSINNHLVLIIQYARPHSIQSDLIPFFVLMQMCVWSWSVTLILPPARANQNPLL